MLHVRKKSLACVLTKFSACQISLAFGNDMHLKRKPLGGVAGMYFLVREFSGLGILSEHYTSFVKKKDWQN